MRTRLEESDTASTRLALGLDIDVTTHVIVAGASAQILVRDGVALLIGPRATTVRKVHAALPAVVHRFAPGELRALVDVPLAALVDDVVRFDEVRARRSRTARDACAVPPSVALVRAALPIAARDPACTVRALAAALGVVERTLHRAFVDAVGLAPKLFLRTARLRRALDLARSRSTSATWAHVAAGAGYFDQAHLIDEARALTGRTPRALVAELASTSHRL